MSKPWTKKPKLATSFVCDCGNPTTILKHGEPVCQRCAELESMSHRFVNPPLDEEAIRFRDNMAARRRRRERPEKIIQIGSMGILISGYGIYAL